MNFYQRINQWYEKIFPLNMKQVEHVKKLISFNGNILEIGSAKGYLSHALQAYYQVIGIDLDESFILEAKRAFPENHFLSMDMLDISKHFQPDSMDGIICFGNTLVHLDSYSMIDDFLKSCHLLLKENGVLSLQIVNYDRVLDQHILSLPRITNKDIEFIRNYQVVENRIQFNTVLKVHETNEEVRNSIFLYPLRKRELHELLLKYGFRDIHFQSAFDDESYNLSKIPLIVSCKK